MKSALHSVWAQPLLTATEPGADQGAVCTEVQANGVC